MRLATRLDQIKPSATLAVSAKAAELRSAGVDVVSLGTGEPDFDTPAHIKAAAEAAMAAGMTKYTAVDGTPALKEAIIGKLLRDNRLSYEPNQIIASTGAKQALYNALLALVDPNDEVILPAPYWVSYPDMVALAGGRAKIVSTDASSGYRLGAEQLEAAITPRTRVLILNSPSNPTGQVYSRSELEAIAEVLQRHPQVVVLSDEIYEHIYWGHEPLASLAGIEALHDRVLVVNGVSKAYAMTGWRIGYAAGHPDLIRAMKKLQSQSTSNPCSIAQAAATAALDGDQGVVAEMAAVFHERHDRLIPALNDLPGVTCLPAEGAFYAFADFSEVMRQRGMADDVALAADILEQVALAMVPGSAFGAPGHLRLSYATSDDNLAEALARLNRYLKGH